MNRGLFGFAFLLLLTSAAQADVYRWVDQNGRVRYTDTPPPASARGVERKDFRGNDAAPGSAPRSYTLQHAMKNFPVTLYTAPSCKQPCALARGALNKRGVPFKEVQVWDAASNAELQRVSGSNEVPVLKVGATVQKGFAQAAFDSVLDSAGYPRAGVLPPGAQKAPATPEGYAGPGANLPRARPEAAEPEEPSAPRGPYAPR